MIDDEPIDSSQNPLSADNQDSVEDQQSPQISDENKTPKAAELFIDDDEATADGASGLHEYEEVPQEVLDRALEQMVTISAGNNAKKEDIELTKFDGRVHRFQAVQHYVLEKQITDRDAKGRMKGEVVGSRDEAMREIDTHLEHMSQDKDLIKNTIQVLKARKDLGFALENETIRLDKYKKTYVMHSKCNQCGGTTSNNCANCQGRREIVCQRCQGEQTYICPTCSGSQYVNGQDGKRLPCTRCQGRGRITCEKCHGKGMMPCHICKGSGKQQCGGCNATGMLSHMVYMQVVARSQFNYDKQMLPQELIEQVDRLGPEIVTQKHGEVLIIEDEETIKEERHQDQRNEYHISYQVKIPFGDIEFALKQKPIKGKLFGYRPKLLQMPPFLEKLAAKGFKYLSQAAQGQGNVNQTLKNSLNYKVLQDVLFQTATQSIRKADSNLAALYPFGIRQKSIREYLKRSQVALKHVTQKPVMQGIGIGAGAASAIIAAYYLSPAQAAISKAVNNTEIEIAIDTLLLAAACGVTFLAFRFKCKTALKNLFGSHLEDEQLKKLSPATPGMIYGVFAGLAAVQILMMEIGFAINESAPLWYQILRAKIGL